MNTAIVILRLPAVMKRTGLSRSSNYLWISKVHFPAPVSLGARAIGWVESEIDEWIAGRIAQSRVYGSAPKCSFAAFRAAPKALNCLFGSQTFAKLYIAEYPAIDFTR